MAPNSDDVHRRHSFDDSVWTEILCRLPSTKYVFQCMCVSKHWKSLISDQYFIHRFTDYHRKNYGPDFNPDQRLMLINYFSWKKREATAFSVSMGDQGTKQLGLIKLPLPGDEVSRQCNIYQVQSSFNDLLLVSRKMGSLTTYHVVNLFTKEHVELPLCDSPAIPPNGINYVGFVCESFYKRGERQFDLTPNYRYRVIRIIYKRHESCSIATYYSETKQWSVLTGLDPNEYECYGNVVAHGRKIYWFNLTKYIIVYDPFVATDESRFNFVGFDKALVWYGCYDCKLVESQGPLLMVQTKGEQGRYVLIWKLKEGDGHVSDESFCFERRIMIDHFSPRTMRVLSVHPSNQDIIFFSSYHSPRVASYNLRTKEWRVVWEEIEGDDFEFHRFGITAALPWWPTPIH